jgi:tetratricopeptide (TPR) repeat protein
MWHQSKLTRDDAREAKRLFDRALRQDPDSIDALIQLAWWHFWDVSTRRGPPDGWEEMKRLAQRALLRDPHESRALYAIGVATMMQGDAVAARIPLRQSIELNPSHAWSYATLGTTYILTGDPEESIEPIKVAMRLSPHDFFIFHAYGELAAAQHMLGQWDAAIEAAEHSLKLRAGYWYAHMMKTASLARAGRTAEAARALNVLARRRPNLCVRDIEWLPFVDRQWPRYFVEGLTLAGWTPPKREWNEKIKKKLRSASDGRFTRAP